MAEVCWLRIVSYQNRKPLFKVSLDFVELRLSPVSDKLINMSEPLYRNVFFNKKKSV